MPLKIEGLGGVTILEFNCDGLVCALHQEPTIAFESVRASRSRLEGIAQHYAQMER